jgi:hypothetical protein
MQPIIIDIYAMIGNIDEILKNGITIQSSGTSGPPKSFFQSPSKIKAANLVALESQNITETSKIYTCCKLTHAGGLLTQTVPALSIGATVDIVKFSAYDFVRDIVKYTHSHITPLHAKAIMLTKGFKSLDLSGIWITCGAEPVAWDIIESFVGKGAIFMTNWGMSEIGPIAINTVFKNLDEVYLHKSLTPDNATLLGDRYYCDIKIENQELIAKGDISIYDDWYYTKDKVLEIDNRLYYLGRTNKEIDLWKSIKG